MLSTIPSLPSMVSAVENDEKALLTAQPGVQVWCGDASDPDSIDFCWAWDGAARQGHRGRSPGDSMFQGSCRAVAFN